MGRFTGWVAAFLMVTPAAAHAEWRQYQTANFIIYSAGSEKDVTRLAEGLETVDGLMRMASGVPLTQESVKVRIYQVGGTEEVEGALGYSNSGIAGFYTSNMLGPYAVTPSWMESDENGFSAELVLHHEYAHHFMLEYFPAVYPSWYVEGYAELIGASKMMPDGRIAYGFPAKYRGDQITNDWVPLKDVLARPSEQIPSSFDLYGQGWVMTHFLTFSNERAKQLRHYLAALNAGKPPAEAAQAFGDLGQLNREAHIYLDSRSFAYRPVAVPIKRPVIERVLPVSAGEAALIPETIAFSDDDLSGYRKPAERLRQEKLRHDNLARIEEKAARFPADPYALILLSTAEYVAGRYGESEAAADRLLALQPNHARALTMKSLCVAQAASKLAGAARDGKAAEARSLAVRANKADPNEVLALVAYYQGYHMVGATPPHQAVVGLAAASATLPQDTRIRQLLVDELAAEKHWHDAIIVLSPIAYDPHDSPQRAGAREQMAQLQAAFAKERGAAAPVTTAAVAPNP